MKLSISLLSVFISATTVFAQEEPQPVQHLFSVRDLYYISGFTVQGFPNGTLAEFRTSAPSSHFLNRNLGNFSENNGYTVSTGSMVSVTAGINFKNKLKNYYRPNPQLRIGFSYYSGADIKNKLTYEDRIRFDTINYNGQPVYRDTVINSNYRVEHRTKQLRLDLSAIFRTERMDRWSFYGGAGITIGAALNSYTTINFRYTTYIDSSNVAGHSILGKKRHALIKDYSATEVNTGRNGICYSFYFPVGMDFRVGKRIEFLRHVHLFYEMRPGFYYISIPELHQFRSPGMNIGFGLRIAIN